METRETMKSLMEEAGIPLRYLSHFERGFRLSERSDIHSWFDDAKHYFMEISDFAWVSPKGDIYYVDFGCHYEYASIFLGELEESLEKTHAKVAYWTYTPEQAWKYVERVTPKMKAAVLEVFANRSVPL